MKTIFTIRGTIQRGHCGSYPTIMLLHPKSGWKQDLVGRLMEMQANFNKHHFQLNYYIVEKPMSVSEITEMAILKTVGGYMEAEYSSYETGYSEWTQWTEHKSKIEIGRHDLLKELANHVGKFLYLTCNIKDN